MVLVDTSVWIKFLSNKLEGAANLSELLVREQIAGHAFVYGELLIGDLGGRLALLRDYPLMTHLETLAHGEVVEFVRSRKLHGRGIGWVDAHLLASSLVSGALLWTTDPRLSALANELHVAYAAA